jgi:hypothetical protein
VIRVKIVRPTVADGGRPLDVGEVCFLADAEASQLIRSGKAVAVIADPSAPVPEHRDPAPTGSRRDTGAR